MHLASIASLLSAARRTFVRFPATLLSAMLAAAVAIHIFDKSPVPDRLTHLLMVAALGIPLFTALRLIWEKSPRGRPLARHWIPMVAGAVFLFLYWHLLNRDPGETRFLRYFQISLALHLAVALAPFLGRGETNGFWQFNRRLFLRSFLSGIYAVVFFGGLALALLAVDNLFDVKINDKIYPRLWIFTVFVFQTWHFLGGVPSNLTEIDRDREHPKGLQIFSQYMLVPLVVLYFFILYSYMGKILLSRDWPQGWVGWLVSIAAIFGVLTLLLLHPGSEEQAHRWIRRFGRAFYVAVLPLLGLLFTALGKRIGQYGMTEKRYFLLILGVWLGGVALYMLLSRAKSIKVIPATLGLTALLTACGPWGAYGVSLRSQSRRLETLLTRNHLLSGGRIVTSSTPVTVPEEDLKEIGATLSYLVGEHGVTTLNRWDPKDWTAEAAKENKWSRPTVISGKFMHSMGLESQMEWNGTTAYLYYTARSEPLDIAGFRTLVHVELYRWSDPRTGTAADPEKAPRAAAPETAHAGDAGEPAKFMARLADDGKVLEILHGRDVSLTQPLAPFLDRLDKKGMPDARVVPASDLCLDAANAGVRARICFTNLTVLRQAPEPSLVHSGTGYLLVDPKP